MSMPGVGLCAQLACLWEATARKPGNVHRYCDFADTKYLDFVTSAAAIAPVFDKARQLSVGTIIHEAIAATQAVVRTNTNLGIVLLLAPLAAVPKESELSRDAVLDILERLDVTDARLAYRAIRLARPSGLGRVADQDVAAEPTQTLRQVMTLAAQRDLVARQYDNGFHEIFEDGVQALERGLGETRSLEGAIIACHLRLLADHPDSLIARKRGQAEAEEVSRRARRVLEGRESLTAFDAWLRAEGHSRNPGTTADLVTACLFVALRRGRIALPSPYPWTAELPS
jgi:triphosphoribosyl-dephospho-CoA synthase